eukprot:1145683-Pelagomonas_calceolata.AAC.3
MPFFFLPFAHAFAEECTLHPPLLAKYAGVLSEQNQYVFPLFPTIQPLSDYGIVAVPKEASGLEAATPDARLQLEYGAFKLRLLRMEQQCHASCSGLTLTLA